MGPPAEVVPLLLRRLRLFTYRLPALTIAVLLALPAVGSAEKSPWAGSSLTYTNAVRAMALDEGSELTHNPYYAMSLGVVAQWNITDIFYLHGRMSLTRELTNSDVTTDDGETWLSDLTFRLGASQFYTIPVAGIYFSGLIDIITPTSPTAKARTLEAGLAPALGIGRYWDVLGGIHISYRFQATRYFYEYTTSQRELPLIGGCDSSQGGCASHENLGLRNAEWRLGHTFALSIGFTKWMGIRASGSLYTDYLFDEVTSERVSYEPQVDQDQRFVVSTDLALTFRPVAALGIAIGAATTNAQLDTDSSFETPFFNKNTVVYLDLTLDIDGLVSQIRGQDAPTNIDTAHSEN